MVFFTKRVWLFIPLFTGAIALPAIFNFITPGRPVFTLVTLAAPINWGPFHFPGEITITEQGLRGAAIFILRVAISVSLSVLLILTTEWARLLRALSALRFPRVGILILGMTYRYIFLFIKVAEEMFLARRSRIVGRTSTREQQRWVSARLGFMLQMGLPKKEVEERVNEALSALAIEKLRNRVPYQLSEGEKKKVALASLLALDPEVWLLDEPTANLDPRTQDWVIEFFLSLTDKGKTLIVAIHELEVAEVIAGQAYILDEDHRLIAQGRPKEILRDEELLLQANLLHHHRHFHAELEHRHPHRHQAGGFREVDSRTATAGMRMPTGSVAGAAAGVNPLVSMPGLA